MANSKLKTVAISLKIQTRTALREAELNRQILQFLGVGAVMLSEL